MASLDDLLGSPSIPASPAQSPTGGPNTAPSASPGTTLSHQPTLDSLLDHGQKTDPLTGEKIPLQFSGHTPETAMNQNPESMSTMDRVKLSLGNQAGNINYLKQKFEDVKPILDDKGKPSQELAVKDKGTWYRVNPKNGDIADPWEKTKEYLKDAAEYAPSALGWATGATVDALSGGATIPETAAIAGGTNAAVRTSLGRMVGTYQASPLEQTWDMAFESMLNVAGVKVLAGVKPTISKVAGWMDAVKETFKDTVEPMAPAFVKKGAQMLADAGGAVANAPKVFMKKMLTQFVGENNFDTALENVDRFKAMAAQYASGNNNTKMYEQLRVRQTEEVAAIADKSRQTLTQIYGGMKANILKDIPDNFSVNLETPVTEVYSDALKAGLGKLMVKQGDTFTPAMALEGKEALDYLGKKGLKGATFVMKSRKELQGAIAEGSSLKDGIGTLATDEEVYNTMAKFYNELGTFTKGADRAGAAGADDLLDFKKIATNMSYSLANSESVQAHPEIKSLLDNARHGIDRSINQEMSRAGLQDRFIELNKTYNELSDSLQPLLKAKKQYDKSGNLAVYEGLIDKFTSRPGKNAAAKEAVDVAIQAADKYGVTDLKNQLLDHKTNIQIAEAVKAFNPLQDSSYKAKAITTGQTLGATYMLTHGDWKTLGALVAVKALASPAAPEMAIATSQAYSKGQEVLSKMSKSQIMQFAKSPEAIDAWTTAIVQAPLVRAQAHAQMQSILQQATQPAQQQPQGQGQ